MIIESNTLGKTVITIHQGTDASFAPNTFVVNNTISVGSNASFANVTETITGLVIERILWTGDWTICRGTAGAANNVFVANNSGAGVMDFFDNGMTLTYNSTANVIVTQGTNAGTLYVRWRKQGTVVNPSNF